MATNFASSGAPAEPFLKWPGGKRLLASRIANYVPGTFGRYFEPFLGGGALFFTLGPAASLLSDSNAELINCYEAVRYQVNDVIAALGSMPNTELDYYRVRESRPTTSVERAARLIYLTTLAFNGIHRVNLRGEFNVPYGHKTHLDPVNEKRLLSASALLSRADLRCSDFDNVVASAEPRDLIYMDPPFTVAHNKNSFVKYNDRIFSWTDQQRLARTAARLVDRGCYVIVSNADHQSIRDLYPQFEPLTLSRFSGIAANKEKRRTITECLFVGGI